MKISMKRILALAAVILAVSAGTSYAVVGIGWGQSGDIPVKGDFDGNGTDDVAVYRPSDGMWYIRNQPPFVQWGGQSGDVPVPGDYDGDGDTDVAIYRASEGIWYIKDQLPYMQWGISGDIPVPADYDGNGTTDIATFRPSEGIWYVKPEPVSSVVVGAVGDACSTPTDCAPSAAAMASMNADAVLMLGDLAYPNGALSDFTNFYHPNYGQFNDIVKPAPGNHEYQTPSAADYFAYFHGVESYYSYDLGGWHLISLNSEIPVSNGSTQENWLEADLATVPAGTCILAYWHQPRFSSGGAHGDDSTYHQLWVDLYAKGADLVLNGHDHNYERFAQQNPSAVADPNGIREFVVGTGGRTLRAMGTTKANSEVRNATSYGALKLTLHPGSYDWQFVPAAGSTLNDSGSDSC